MSGSSAPQNAYASRPAESDDFKQLERIASGSREAGQRRVAILVNLRGRDVEGFVKEAFARIKSEVNFPPGYYFEFGGQFENLQAARLRLAIVVPLAIALIFVLLVMSFGTFRQAALIFVCVPLAVTGGVFVLWHPAHQLHQPTAPRRPQRRRRPD